MGDEIALGNDDSYLKDPSKAADNRWLHRPLMDWQKAAKRHEAHTLEAQLFGKLKQMIEIRSRTPQFHNSFASVVLDSPNPHLFIHKREHPLGNLLAVYNFSENSQELSHWLPDLLAREGISWDKVDNLLEANPTASQLAAYGRLWLLAMG
ncbi:MAG: hypothetical protein R2880_09050 [Deinococcales bacterium]